MKHLLTVLALCFAFTWTCAAQRVPDNTPASKEDVERYLDAMHAHDMLIRMMQAMSKPMNQMLHDQYMRDKDNLPPDFEAQITKSRDAMMKDLPIDEMIQAMVPTYQRHFTKGDIDYLISFYSSPTGQKFLRDGPAMAAEAMQDTMPIMRKHLDKINESLQKQIAEMRKESTNTSK